MSLSRWLVSGWCLVVALGVGLAALEWSALIAAALFVGGFACLATTAALLPAPRDGATGARRWTACLLGAATIVALLALAAASAALTVLVLLLAVVTLTPVLALRRPRRVREQPHVRVQPEPPDRDRSFDDLDCRQLCALWRALFWQLVDQQTAEERAATVTQRQACLEELERRNPQAVRAWIASGARASGGPDRFLTGGGHPGDVELS